MARKTTGQKRGKQERGRGSIVGRGPDRWLVRVYVGTETVNGAPKRKYVAQTVAGKYRQAEQELTRMLREMDTGTFVAPTKQTLREYLTGYASDAEEKKCGDRDAEAGKPRGWLRVTAAPRVEPKTLIGYKDALRLHVLPALGGRRLDAIHGADVERLYAGMSARGLSPRTVRLVHTVLKNALKHAVRQRLVGCNPCDVVDPPRQVRNEQKVLTAEQVRTLLAVAKDRGDAFYAFWHLLLMSGLRPAEARALKWSDLDGKQVRVQRAMKELPGGAWGVGEPKTQRSRRTVTLPTETVAALQAHRTRQAAQILAGGSRYERADLIFANEVGKPLDQSLLRRQWSAALTAAKLPPVRLYDARHTHATLLLASNQHAKVVSERLGHSSVTLTLDTYSHVLPEMRQQTAELLDVMLAQRVG